MIFDPDKVEDEEFKIVSEGEHRVMILDSVYGDTKAGTGRMLTVAFEVVEGADKGLRFKDRFNLENKNPTAEKIGQQQLKKLLKVIGVTSAFDIKDIDRLISRKVLRADIVHEQDGDKIYVNVKKYMPDATSYGAGAISRTSNPISKQSLF